MFKLYILPPYMYDTDLLENSNKNCMFYNAQKVISVSLKKTSRYSLSL